MKLVQFPEANGTYAKDQPEYIPLPSHKDEQGIVTSCYELTWKEKIAILFGAKVWLQLLTFNKPLQPQRLYVSKTMES